MDCRFEELFKPTDIGYCCLACYIIIIYYCCYYKCCSAAVYGYGVDFLVAAAEPDGIVELVAVT